MNETITTEQFRDTLRAARRAGTPLIAICTADPASAIQHMIAALNGKAESTPLIAYDFIRGLHALNKEGKAAMSIFGENVSKMGPADSMAALEKLSPDSVVFFQNPQRIWEQPDVLQAIWNLRDTFKAEGNMLVLLTTLGMVLPIELQNDVMVFDEPLPSEKDLQSLTVDTFKAATLPPPTIEIIDKVTDALIGLSSFAAEQVLAMSLSKKGVDFQMLWERKRQAIEETPGLSVWRGGETFDQIGGCDNVKGFLKAVLAGRNPPRVVVFVDEIEKAFAGTGTDTSGVKTELTGTLLSHMQDREADGLIFIGPPGAAKSAIAKAAGASAEIPTIAFDFSAMQSGIIGSSGERLRAALQVVDAISQGRSLWIATCNSIASLPPELRRRFRLGTYMFDLPDSKERAAIWKIYIKKWDLNQMDLAGKFNDEGWTGAEIRECCYKAWRLKISLQESAEYIVPVAKSAADIIDNLRKQAEGKFLSASHPGVYTIDGPVSMQSKTRKIGV